MAGPQFVKYMAPIVAALKELGSSGTPAEVYELVARKLGISDTVLNEVTKNGNSRYENQVAWARFYLAKAGYLDSSKRGVWSLTEAGNASHITADDALTIFKRVQKDIKQAKGKVGLGAAPSKVAHNGESSEAELDANDSVRSKLLELLKSLPPNGFERLCQRLLRESGFQQVTVTGKTGDGGIDGKGILQVNALLSFQVIFQCKRFAGRVGADLIRNFRGSMTGRTDKGIFLTTGTFSSEARNEALREGAPPIELVDGEKLVTMFEQLELGLVPRRTYDIDAKFFEEYQSE